MRAHNRAHEPLTWREFHPIPSVDPFYAMWQFPLVPNRIMFMLQKPAAAASTIIINANSSAEMVGNIAHKENRGCIHAMFQSMTGLSPKQVRALFVVYQRALKMFSGRDQKHCALQSS